MSHEELKVLVDATVRLTELRLKDTPHLCIENFAPELLAKLVGATRSEVFYTPEDPRWQCA